MKPIVRKKIPLYGGGLTVALTQADYTKQRLDITSEHDDSPPTADQSGLSENLTGKDGRITYLVGVFDGSTGTLVHELGHVAFMVLKNCGVGLGPHPHESYCYVLDALYQLATEE